jgi:hypothetical protein
MAHLLPIKEVLQARQPGLAQFEELRHGSERWLKSLESRSNKPN